MAAFLVGTGGTIEIGDVVSGIGAEFADQRYYTSRLPKLPAPPMKTPGVHRLARRWSIARPCCTEQRAKLRHMSSNELLSVAPTSMSEDEVTIARGYKTKLSAVAALIPLVTLWFTHDVAVIAAVGFATVCGLISASEARLYDLCIRLKRTNALLLNQTNYVEQIKSIDLRLFYLVDAIDAENLSKQKSDKQHADLIKKINILNPLLRKP